MKKKKDENGIFNSIRKSIARGSVIFKSKKEKYMNESFNLDNEDEMKFAVDIPQDPSFGVELEWINLGYFETKQEAVEFCKSNFGSDDEGNINLITEV